MYFHVQAVGQHNQEDENGVMTTVLHPEDCDFDNNHGLYLRAHLTVIIPELSNNGEHTEKVIS